MKNFLYSLACIIVLLSGVNTSAQETDLELYFFYSETCPHCADEKKFLNEIKGQYPQVEFKWYIASAFESQDILESLIEKHQAERYQGLVPLTFVGEDFFVGFDSPERKGEEIRQSIERQLGIGEAFSQPQHIRSEQSISVPLLGEIDMEKYSLPVLAITLGFLDGFNVCSLGALILILGLVLFLKSRKKIALYGGLFIGVTAVIYGFLIVLWYQLFSFMSRYLQVMEFVIGIIGITGGLYFLHEFYTYKKYGPQCESSGLKIVSKMSRWIQERFKKGNGLMLVGAVIVFAAIIAIVEFPCSAAVPVIFAGILVEAGISTSAYYGYIGLFTLFYMLDEIIIFAIAVYKMHVWMASPKFLTWIVFIEGIILFSLGVYYLSSLL